MKLKVFMFVFLVSIFAFNPFRVKAETYEDNRVLGDYGSFKMEYHLLDNGDILVEFKEQKYTYTIPSSGKEYIVVRNYARPEIKFYVFDKITKLGDVWDDRGNQTIKVTGSCKVYGYEVYQGNVKFDSSSSSTSTSIWMFDSNSKPLILNNSIAITDGVSNFFLKRPLVQPSVLSSTLRKAETEQIPKTITGMMILLIPLTVSFLALRKGWTMLSGVLRRA